MRIANGPQYKCALQTKIKLFITIHPNVWHWIIHKNLYSFFRIRFYKCQLELVTCPVCTKGSETNVFMLCQIFDFMFYNSLFNRWSISIQAPKTSKCKFEHIAFCFTQRPAKESYELSCHILQCNGMGYCF